MSKIGRRPILLPSDVQVATSGQEVTVTGPKGTLHWTLPREVTLRLADGTILIDRGTDTPYARAQHGLARALVANMVLGVGQGFSKQLKIVGVGYRAEVTGTGLRLSLGYSHPIDVAAPAGITFAVEKNVITVSGIDKQLVGETAARIRGFKKPEPYKGKGVMYVDEVVRRKPGKAAKAVAGAAGGAA